MAKCLHISASYLHCPLGDDQHTSQSQQDYRDKIGPKWILHCQQQLVYKSQTFEGECYYNLQGIEKGGVGRIAATFQQIKQNIH